MKLRGGILSFLWYDTSTFPTLSYYDGNHRSNDRGNHHSNHRGYYDGYYNDNT